MDRGYEIINVEISFANPSYSFQNEELRKDLDKAIKYTDLNLMYRTTIGMSDYDINSDGTLKVQLIYPNNLPKCRAPMYLSRMARYLLKTYPEKYSKAKVGSRLFNYHVIYEVVGEYDSTWNVWLRYITDSPHSMG